MQVYINFFIIVSFPMAQQGKNSVSISLLVVLL